VSGYGEGEAAELARPLLTGSHPRTRLRVLRQDVSAHAIHSRVRRTAYALSAAVLAVHDGSWLVSSW